MFFAMEANAHGFECAMEHLSPPSHPHPAPLAEASLRENINKHEGDSDQKTKPGLSTERSCDPPEIRPPTKFSLSENVSCLNKAIEFSQVGIK